MSPRLTIGLPVYNGKKYLPEALDALLGQSFANFELMISDNASTDRTGEICCDYEASDKRVKYFRQPANLGCASNHNVLVHAARGEYINWASDDDRMAVICSNAVFRFWTRIRTSSSVTPGPR